MVYTFLTGDVWADLVCGVRRRLIVSLAARMILLMNEFQSRLVNVCVDLGGRDTRVAEHFLNLSQVSTTCQ